MTWTVESDLVADFRVHAEKQGYRCYAESCGWDLLLVREVDGFQIGVEAKLSLNAKVLCQVLAHDDAYGRQEGPDCRAVLVPAAKAVNGLATIAARLAIVVILGSAPDSYGYGSKKPRFEPSLPKRSTWDISWGCKDEFSRHGNSWPERCPDKRLTLPEYVPDVVGGRAAPVTLTVWKILAIKVQIILEARGWITRDDFKFLKLDSRRWTQHWLENIGDARWVAKAPLGFDRQHPVNYAQIKADYAKWAPEDVKEILAKRMKRRRRGIVA